MSMKLSYRDKVIVIVVAVLVILGVGIFCFIKPQMESLQASDDRLTAKQSEEAQVKDRIGTLDDLVKRLEDDIESVEESQKKFISERENGETFQINMYLSTLLESSNIDIKSMLLSDLEATDLMAYEYDKLALAYPLKIYGDLQNELPEEVMNAYNGTSIPISDYNQVAGTIVTIGYECDEADEVFSAIDLIANCDENIYLITCGASYEEPAQTDSGESGRFEGEMVVLVYEIYPIDVDGFEDSLKELK